MTAEACAAARRLGLTVSFDLNFRAKLWSTEKAGAVLTPLMEHVDLCVTSVEEADAVFGVAAKESGTSREEATARKLGERFGFHSVALTQRKAATASATQWGAMLYIGGAGHFSRRHEITIVDRVGAGDSFTGALIFSLLRGDHADRAVEFAVAASTLKHSIPGDYNLATLEEIEALAAGGSGGRIRR